MTLAPEAGVLEPDATPPTPEADVAREPVLGCTIDVDGAVWTVSDMGTARSGTGPDGGAFLLLLRFTEQAGSERRVREALAVARSLEELGFEELEALFRRSRAAKDPEMREAPSAGGEYDTVETVDLPESK